MRLGEFEFLVRKRWGSDLLFHIADNYFQRFMLGLYNPLNMSKLKDPVLCGRLYHVLSIIRHGVERHGRLVQGSSLSKFV